MSKNQTNSKPINTKDNNDKNSQSKCKKLVKPAKKITVLREFGLYAEEIEL